MNHFQKILPIISGGPIEPQLPIKEFNNIAIIGEAPNESDIIENKPFSGKIGERLEDTLSSLNIDINACLLANIFQYRPKDDRLNLFFASKARTKAEKLEVNTVLPMYLAGNCIVPFDEDIRNLWRLLKKYQPKTIIALGNTALWGLCWKSNLNKYAGQKLETQSCMATVIPTYHPHYLLRRKNKEEEVAFYAHLKTAKELAERKIEKIL